MKNLLMLIVASLVVALGLGDAGATGVAVVGGVRAARVVVAPQHVVVAPQRVVVAPQRVVVAPQRVVVAPQRIVVAPQRVVVAPHAAAIVAPRVRVVAPPRVRVVQPRRVFLGDTSYGGYGANVAQIVVPSAAIYQSAAIQLPVVQNYTVQPIVAQPEYCATPDVVSYSAPQSLNYVAPERIVTPNYPQSQAVVAPVTPVCYQPQAVVAQLYQPQAVVAQAYCQPAANLVERVQVLSPACQGIRSFISTY